LAHTYYITGASTRAIKGNERPSQGNQQRNKG
jgi:hypothetical protein